MAKGMFLSLPSVSVVNTLTPIVEYLESVGLEVVYYNSQDYRPKESYHFQFTPYPDFFKGYYSDKIDERTTYFDFGEILLGTAISLIDFLTAEVEREKPDFIMHSHLAVWGKLLARHFNLPEITLYTTFVLDKQIMLPYFRKISDGYNSSFTNVNNALSFHRKSRSLSERLALSENIGLWDVYINKGDLNLLFILDAFQPQRELFGPEFKFLGPPIKLNEERCEKTIIYVAMGTIVNKDIEFYRLCITVLRGLTIPCIISIGSQVDIKELGPLPTHVTVVPYVDQFSLLKKAKLFITRSGMSSVHEAIYAHTPMIAIPIIPEQRLTAEKIEELGIGIHLPASQLTVSSLHDSIQAILDNEEVYLKKINTLINTIPVSPPEVGSAHFIDALLKTRQASSLAIHK